ncbi:MAG: TonB-dependent receptor [Prevotella sp.]|nr:TonB-dependent receptor [Prevotella sp.]
MKQVNIRIPFRMLGLLLGLFLSVGAFAQINVKGHVKDATGEPIIGATIRVVGSQTATVTDFDGNFVLNANQGADLQVSYVGYQNQTVKAAPNVVVTLVDDETVLENVVVIGYGRAKKNDLTGSVTAIKPDEMSKGITTNVQDMLSGKIAGVNITDGGGTPGGSSTIRIRGGSSLSANNDPLIIIDGLAIDNNGVQGLSNGLSMVNPEDIETLTVLKDASATAIYGSRASNGVIIITTKKGSKGQRAKVTYNGNVSIATVAKKRELLNGDEFRTYAQSLVDKGLVSASAMSVLGAANTDWQDEIYRNAVSTDHQISVTGALKNIPYRVSLGYTGQDGIAKTSNFQRYTAALNLNPTLLNDHLNVDFSAKYMYAVNRYVDGGVFGGAVAIDPTQPVSAPDFQTTGGYFQNLISGGAKTIADWTGAVTNTNTPQNPVALYNNKDDRSYANVFLGNLGFAYKIHGFEDLSVNASISGDYSTGKQFTNNSPYSYSNNYYGWTGYSKSRKYNLQVNGFLNYTHNWNDVHDLNIMAGAEEQHFHRHTWGAGGGNWIGSTLNTNEASWYSPSLESENTHTYVTTLVSYFARLQYNLLDRYLLTATFRNDNSSRFADGKRAGYFPSAALAWKISNEPFMKNIKAINELKLRLSYGITGQQDIGNDFYYLRRYVSSDQYAQYAIGNKNYYTMRPEMFNEDLTWEKTTTYDIGLDFGILNNRIEGGIDVYYRKTKDLISTVSIASGIAFGNYKTMNVGDLENTGVEFNITARPVVTKDFTWQLSYNVGWNKNKITNLKATGGDFFLTGNSISAGLSNQVMVNKEGYPTNSFYVYQQVYDADGKPIEGVFVDRNGDGTINADDKYVYKKQAGDVLMGMTSKFLFKNFDLSFSLRASFNNYLFNDFLCNKCNGANVFANGAWSNTTPEAVQLGFTGKPDYYMSDYFIENASFLKCDNITLGYSFKDFLKNSNYGGIAGRVYVLVQNPFVITNYSGIDPENASGVDGSVYPRPRTYMLGLNLNF